MNFERLKNVLEVKLVIIAGKFVLQITFNCLRYIIQLFKELVFGAEPQELEAFFVLVQFRDVACDAHWIKLTDKFSEFISWQVADENNEDPKAAVKLKHVQSELQSVFEKTLFEKVVVGEQVDLQLIVSGFYKSSKRRTTSPDVFTLFMAQFTNLIVVHSIKKSCKATIAKMLEHEHFISFNEAVKRVIAEQEDVHQDFERLSR